MLCSKALSLCNTCHYSILNHPNFELFNTRYQPKIQIRKRIHISWPNVYQNKYRERYFQRGPTLFFLPVVNSCHCRKLQLRWPTWRRTTVRIWQRNRGWRGSTTGFFFINFPCFANFSCIWKQWRNQREKREGRRRILVRCSKWQTAVTPTALLYSHSCSLHSHDKFQQIKALEASALLKERKGVMPGTRPRNKSPEPVSLSIS